MKRTVALLLLTIAVASVPALATNGYFVHGMGTASKSMAGAGTALPEDSATVNPAGISFIDSEIYAAIAVFSPHREYTISGAPTGYPGTFGLTPGTVKSDQEYFVMPTLASKWSLNDRSSLGVSFMARGGMDTDYHASTFYGSSPTGVDLQQMFLNATYAFKITPKHSVGISGIVAYQKFEAEGLEAFGAFSSNPAALTNLGYDSSHGYGVKLGYVGQVAPKLNLAVSYSPKISMTEFEDYSGLFASGGNFDIPADTQLGLAFKATDALTLVFDIEHIEYSDVASVGNHFLPNLMQAPLGAEGGAGFGWDDMTVYKGGVRWTASPKLTFRAGYSHGSQPIPETEVLFNIVAPAVIEDHVTFGATTPVRGGNLNFAASYAVENSVTGANPLEAPGAQTIELKMDEWELEMSYSYKF